MKHSLPKSTEYKTKISLTESELIKKHLSMEELADFAIKNESNITATQAYKIKIGKEDTQKITIEGISANLFSILKCELKNSDHEIRNSSEMTELVNELAQDIAEITHDPMLFTHYLKGLEQDLKEIDQKLGYNTQPVQPLFLIAGSDCYAPGPPPEGCQVTAKNPALLENLIISSFKKLGLNQNGTPVFLGYTDPDAVLKCVTDGNIFLEETVNGVIKHGRLTHAIMLYAILNGARLHEKYKLSAKSVLNILMMGKIQTQKGVMLLWDYLLDNNDYSLEKSKGKFKANNYQDYSFNLSSPYVCYSLLLCMPTSDLPIIQTYLLKEFWSFFYNRFNALSPFLESTPQNKINTIYTAWIKILYSLHIADVTNGPPLSKTPLEALFEYISKKAVSSAIENIYYFEEAAREKIPDNLSFKKFIACQELDENEFKALMGKCVKIHSKFIKSFYSLLSRKSENFFYSIELLFSIPLIISFLNNNVKFIKIILNLAKENEIPVLRNLLFTLIIALKSSEKKDFLQFSDKDLIDLISGTIEDFIIRKNPLVFLKQSKILKFGKDSYNSTSELASHMESEKNIQGVANPFEGETLIFFYQALKAKNKKYQEFTSFLLVGFNPFLRSVIKTESNSCTENSSIFFSPEKPSNPVTIAKCPQPS